MKAAFGPDLIRQQAPTSPDMRAEVLHQMPGPDRNRFAVRQGAESAAPGVRRSASRARRSRPSV